MSEFESEDGVQKNESAASDPSAELRAQLEKAKSDYLYLRAEFDTYKRNAIKERSDLVRYGSEKVVVEFLNILDNLERALGFKVTADNLPTYVKGVEMTAQEIRSLMTRLGVSELPCEGTPFDPAFHEALSSEETAVVPEGHISKVFRKPYKLHDRVIRTAQVIVARKPSQN